MVDEGLTVPSAPLPPPPDVATCRATGRTLQYRERRCRCAQRLRYDLAASDEAGSRRSNPVSREIGGSHEPSGRSFTARTNHHVSCVVGWSTFRRLRADGPGGVFFRAGPCSLPSGASRCGPIIPPKGKEALGHGLRTACAAEEGEVCERTPGGGRGPRPHLFPASRHWWTVRGLICALPTRVAPLVADGFDFAIRRCCS